MGVGTQLKHAWNAFLDQSPGLRPGVGDLGAAYGARPDRSRLRIVNERSIIASIYNRIAIDVSMIDIRHVRLDDEGRYKETLPTNLNECLSTEANIDQSGLALILDAVFTMLDRGDIAIVPVDVAEVTGPSATLDILSMRVGHIVHWYPRHVRVEVYNDRTGMREQVTMPKSQVAIIENPLYAVMNETNSTFQRLQRKLGMLDAVDEQSASGKLDLIIQLPYTIKSETKRQQAEQRRQDIEFQLRGNKYGIAYADGTEKITQLNRPVENNLMGQIEYLTQMLYAQLGITAAVMDGTADEATMLNYMNRTIEPILRAITVEIKRKFLSKYARTQKQSIEYFRNPFKLVPMKDLAEMVDKFTRNEVFSSNEIRQFVGSKPSKDPKADKLVNSNMPQLPEGPTSVAEAEDDVVEGEIVEDNPYDGLNTELDGVEDLVKQLATELS